MESMTGDIDRIWSEFSQHLRTFIRRRVEDDDTAEDILQDVFLRIHGHYTSLQDVNKLQGWVFQIARNAIIDHYRLRHPTEAMPEELPMPVDWDDGPDAAEEIAGTLRELVETLPDPYREALMLSDLQGVSQRELASQLGISVSGVKSRVQRARLKIRDALLTCCHFEFDRYGRVVDYWQHCCCCCEEQGPC